jgi:hypothetical protein
MGDGSGPEFTMPDFAPDGNGNLTSEELTEQLLEPEQAAVDDMTPAELSEEDSREIVTGEIDVTPVQQSEDGTGEEAE